MFKFEESAGGIVYKKENSQIYILVTQHSAHHGWVFPKGLLDKGEDKATTALREVREEGGVVAKIVEELAPVEYFYKFQGETIKKKVTYFLMEYVSGKIEDHDWEMEAAEWLPLEKVDERLTYKTDKQVFQKAQEFLTEKG
ncbi:MAG: NUDIX domain-containing protein [bacterium]|nr:NUDIX domain-containing protein [bacterium]